MEEFNYQQKIAMMRILLDIINTDGRIDVRETALYSSSERLSSSCKLLMLLANKLPFSASAGCINQKAP